MYLHATRMLRRKIEKIFSYCSVLTQLSASVFSRLHFLSRHLGVFFIFPRYFHNYNRYFSIRHRGNARKIILNSLRVTASRRHKNAVKTCIHDARNRSGILDGERINELANNSAN